MKILELLERMNPETEVILVLSIILFAGFIMTRLTNTLNMPKVSGYILAGILIGPYCLNFIPSHLIEGMGFISDVALAFIAFGVGKFFKKEVLMRTGKRIIVITVSEALMAGVLVTLVLKVIFRLDWGFALILGAIATATAPASTMMTINQYKAKGEFVNTLLQIVALDDVVCLLAFSIVSAVINGLDSGSLSVNDILIPVFYNILAIGLGVFCGYFLSRLLIPARSRDNRLILAIAMLMGLTGLCAAVDISPLLSCMVFGAVYINLTRDKKLFRQINNFTPPVMSMFFVVSGMNLDLNALTAVGAIGVCYFIIRIIGKYLGTYLSCMVMGTSREIRNYMGFALIPQAGVAIGLAFLGQRVLPEATGDLMLTIILSSSVLYEMVGPISAKAALFLSGSIPGKVVHTNMVETEDGRVVEVAVDGTEDRQEGQQEGQTVYMTDGSAEEEYPALTDTAETECAEEETSETEYAEEETAETEYAEEETEESEGAEEESEEADTAEEETEEAEEDSAEEEMPAGTAAAKAEDGAADSGLKRSGAGGSGAGKDGADSRGTGKGGSDSRGTGKDGADNSGTGKGGADSFGAETVGMADSETGEGKDAGHRTGKSGKDVFADHDGPAEASGEEKEGGKGHHDNRHRKDSGDRRRHSKKKGPKVRKMTASLDDEMTTGLPELREYNQGVDERDDDDVEKMIRPVKPKKKKKKKQS